VLRQGSGMHSAQDRYKHFADFKGRPITLTVGQLVLLSLVKTSELLPQEHHSYFPATLGFLRS
jgi:hypothetical protein